jgi:GDP-mannose 6-dehydrogenase
VRIAVVGLGYVGSVAGACLAAVGHDVTFVEINRTKVEQLNNGLSPVREPELPELIRSGHAAGRLRATDDLVGAVEASDTTLVCVGTPTGPNGDVHLDDLEAVVDRIGFALADRSAWHLVLISSTIPPGTTETMIVPLLEKQSGKTCGVGFGVAFSPEFLREGSAVADFRNPDLTVIGAGDEQSLESATAVFGPFGGRVLTTAIPVAEAVKLAGNAWHALKVTFANEIGRFCAVQQIDSRAVMNVVKQDTRLNISAAYLSPGFAFGGSCLPKDLRTLNYRARTGGTELPVLDNILRSNRAQVDFALEKIERYGRQRIAILGLAFKHGTDDLRESPNLELVERLYGKGYHVTLHDENVSVPHLIGANRAAALRSLPHIASLLRSDLADVLADAEVVVIAQSNPAYLDVAERLSPEQYVLDLTGVARGSGTRDRYEGLVW